MNTEKENEKQEMIKETPPPNTTEIEELRNQLALTVAEMRNYQKRSDAEKAQEMKYASFDFSKNILLSLDALEKALDAQLPESAKSYVDGVRMAKEILIRSLSEEGVEEIVLTPENPYDPKKMRCLSLQHDKDAPNDAVMQVLQKGYMYKDRVLRPVSVVVNQSETTDEVQATEKQNFRFNGGKENV